MRKINSVNYFGEEITRVNKVKARTYWEDCKTVYVLPCKMNPDNMWGMAGLLLPEEEEEGMFFFRPSDFDKLVNEYEHYYCTTETGKYAAFYVRVKEI